MTTKREDLVKIALDSFIELDELFPPTKRNSSTPQNDIAPTQVYSHHTFQMARYQQQPKPAAYQVINHVYNPQQPYGAKENTKVIAYYQTNSRPYALQYSRVPSFASPPPPLHQRPSGSKAVASGYLNQTQTSTSVQQEKPKIMRSGGMLFFGFGKRNK